MKMLYALKDTEFYCKNCNSLYMVVKRDVYSEDRMTPDKDIYQDKGQAPFKIGEHVQCKICHTKLHSGNMRQNRPMSLS